MPDTHTIFLTLRVFSAKGGIEKVCCLVGKALQEFSTASTNRNVKILSLYDTPGDLNNLYFPAAIFSGFGKQRSKFLWQALKEGRKSRVVILSHVNLLVIGFLIRCIAPKTKLVLITHGIEVWYKFPLWKKLMLKQVDKVLPVSEFTKRKMMEFHQLPEEKFTVFNNCLDPFLPLPLSTKKPVQLLHRYNLTTDDIVLLTLTRINSKERYKGYDQVMQAVHDLKTAYPTIKYLIVGKYDAAEKNRIETIINRLHLKNQVILSGFIPDEELAEHFALADIYCMPSRKEGFGIVFIEAMFYGKPVIAGNMDGSVDALKNGVFGLLVNPVDQQQITDGIKEVICNKEKYIPRQQEVMAHFSFEVYKEKLRKIMEEIDTA